MFKARVGIALRKPFALSGRSWPSMASRHSGILPIV